MTTGTRSEITGGTGASAETRAERLARRTAQLYANDPQFSEARPLQAATATQQQPGRKLSQIVATAMEGYADRPALGQRVQELVTDPATGHTSLRSLRRFDTITYRELWTRVGAVASEWRHHPEYPLDAGDFVAILGFTSTDYTTVDLACIYAGAVSVPLQTSAPVAQHVAIITETEPRVLAVGIDYLDDAVDAVLAGAAPQRVIVFDYEPKADDQRAKFDAARRRLADANSAVVVHTLHDVVAHGGALPRAPWHVPDADDDPLLGLIYTSGSTGTPKGAMYTDRMLTQLWLRPSKVPLISLNYMPMSHQYARGWLARTLANGGTGYFAAESDMSTLFEDLVLVRPTALNLVPRVCDMIFEQYLSELDRCSARGADPTTIDHHVKADIRERFLGGRVLSATCGSAPLTAEMHEFTESCLDVHLTIGYGTTEVGGVLHNNTVDRSAVIDYKLVDVPELGYFLTDKPYPRGELLVKTKNMMPGYYKRPDVTAAMFDEAGFYKSGDIMAQIGPDQLVYLDRRNNVLKLSQGEFVAVAQLETVFSASPLIRQIYVYGSSERSFLLAVVVPTPDLIATLARHGEDQVKALISESLQQTARDAGLNGYEIPRDFLIETEPFTLENGLLTGAAKLARPNLKARYGERLEQMYAQIAEDQVTELRALRAGGHHRPVLETVMLAVQATLGLLPADVTADARFTDLGGDSLSALSFSKLLEDIFDIEVPVGVVIDPTADLHQLTNYVDAQRTSGEKRPTFAAVHGREATEVYASDLTLDKFIDAKTLTAATTLPTPSGAVRTVLLTGATGYLGRFLCLNWLERLARTGGTVICIARGSDPAQARRRIEAGFASDAELLARFSALAADHLDVVAGDIGEPNLGLDIDTWNRLAERVDLIVHPAAHVNHVLPYKQLFGANVVGAAELIRLAITTKMKAFNNISSMGAAVVGDHSIDEDADIRIASPVSKLDVTGYAAGYSTSKWAGEVLMREAHDLCGLPVAVFRPDMILAHSHYAGQLNVPDMITRLLFSLVATGIAPRSFYRSDANRDGHRPHYDGLPVDFIAQVVTELGAHCTAGYCTYNVVNPHDDGISLDQFVDWLIDAGNPIQRIDDYDEWVSRCETAMRALPERQRQQSVLMVMDAFRRPTEPVAGATVPCDSFQQAVHAMHQSIPHLSAALVQKYSADLRTLGLL